MFTLGREEWIDRIACFLLESLSLHFGYWILDCLPTESMLFTSTPRKVDSLLSRSDYKFIYSIKLESRISIFTEPSTNVESIRRIVVIPRNRGGLRKTLGHWT